MIVYPKVNFKWYWNKNFHRFVKGQAKDILGEVELILKVSKSPLEEDLRGVSIYSNGVWHETTMAGNEGRET